MDRRARPPKGKVEAKRPLARKPAKEPGGKVRDLEKRLAEALKLKKEALEQQTATAEILRGISSSPADIQPVFDAIARSAARLCGAPVAAVVLVDGDMLRQGAITIASDEWAPFRGIFPRPVRGAGVQELAVAGKAAIIIHDLATDDSVAEYSKPMYQRFRFRSGAWLPMMRTGDVLGLVIVYHTEIGAFGESHISLLKTFADQAVIAIENVRLFNETREALERQTATSEILRVISGALTDVQPVFRAILERATRLCGAELGHLWLYDDDGLFRLAESIGGQIEHLEWLRSRRHRFGRPFFREEGPWEGGQIEDVRTTEPYRRGDEVWVRSVDNEGFRTLLNVPLVKDGRFIGAMSIYRREVRRFAAPQVNLVKTFADQAVIAIENVRLFTELQASNGELATALDRQTATSDILKVISISPTDAQPVFDAIVRAAVQLCHAVQSNVQLFDGQVMHFVAQHNIGPDAMEVVQSLYPMSPNRSQTASRAVLDRAVVHVADVLDDLEYMREMSVKGGFRSVLSVPMNGMDRPIGAITVGRMKPGPFSETEIALLQTFADQAVIAIENVRLFTELQEKNRALTTALDQQTATSEILRAMSGSLTDVQPVFDTIVRSGLRLLGGYSATMMLLRAGECLDLVAYTSTSAKADASLVDAFPLLLRSLPPGERAVHDRRPHTVEDVESAPDVTDVMRETGRTRGWRSNLFVPMIREDVALGLISITRRAPGPFLADQIALLETFAAQAVIAIENVRLFTELQEKNKALTEAHAQVTESLEQQTATSEILRVISRSQTDVQPVFDTIADSAARLCQADLGGLFRVEDGRVHEVSHWFRFDQGLREEMRRAYPRPLDTSTFIGRAILERRVVHVPDMTDPAAPLTAVGMTRLGFRSQLTVPMLHGGEPIGGISVVRRTPGPFSDDQVQLLETFADQAVIAIENMRLFTELQQRTQDLTRSVGQLTALSEVSRALSSTLDLEAVLTTIVSRAVQLSDGSGGVVYEHEPAAQRWELRATHNIDAEVMNLQQSEPIRMGEGAVGRAVAERRPVQIGDLRETSSYAARARVRELLIARGYLSVLAVPLVVEDDTLGALVILRRDAGELAPQAVELMKTFATQSALAIQNARLFREIEIKSRELQVASQHKSEFLANMSHELRTPLNAIIGYSELLEEEAGDLDGGRLVPDLQKIATAAKHQLSLINDILDLSKVEAGRMELEVADFDLPTAIDNALALVRERATRRGISLGSLLDGAPGAIRADERKVKQVLLNLLSNALKFTPEGGRIDVRAVTNGDMVEISVTDTGVGIAAEDQEAVFEEFRQVGTADKKVEGTGLGLALCRKFVELHGGRIWVKSQVGQGSTFTFTLPVRQGV